MNFNKGLSLKKTKSVKTIDQIRKQYNKRKDHTKDNLRKLGALSKNKVNKEKTTSVRYYFLIYDLKRQWNPHCYEHAISG